MSTPAFTAPAPLRLSAAVRPLCRRRVSTTTLRHTTFLPSLRPLPAPLPAACARRSPRAPAMALQHVVVAGGTGFVGSRLVRHLQGTGAQVTVLTRSRGSASALSAATRVVVWAPDKLAAVGDDWVGWQDSLRGADLVVNLCGEPVVSRWDARGRQAIVESRVKATTALAEAVRDMPTESRPKCVVSASAVGYYGTSAATVFDEGAAPARDDFLADVCVRWEEAAKGVLEGVEGTRLVVVRIGVVLGVGGGALARMLPAFKMFVGGKVGSGEQWVSWVHVDDLVRIFVEAGENEDMRGVYNATAPRPVTMGELAQALADALKRPNLFPVPGVVLKLALGGAAQVVLEGQKVLPKRLLERGFKFQHETVESAMKAVAEEA